MKKILIEGMSFNLGGLETFIHLLYSVLKKDYQIDFLVFDETIPFQQEFLNQGCHIYWTTPRSRSIRQYEKDLNALFKKGNYDVFWFNKTTLSSISSLKAAKKNGVKKVICHSHQSKNMGSAFTAVMHNLNRCLIGKYVDYKVACSQVAADYFYGKNAKDVILLQNAVDVTKYEPNDVVRKEMRKKLGVEGKLVLGNVARFSPEKNHKYLVDVLEALSKTIDVHLILCGTGELMDQTKQLVNDKNLSSHVSFLGMRNDIPEILQALDVFVMPSLFEGLPFTLVEAQAAGVPCVVSSNISMESKLTDIVDFVDLDSNVNDWKDAILKFTDYTKVSKRNQLEEKGFTVEAFEKKVREMIG